MSFLNLNGIPVDNDNTNERVSILYGEGKNNRSNNPTGSSSPSTNINRTATTTTTTTKSSSSFTWIAFVYATLYVLSGVSQPLLMTFTKNAGLADPIAQIYMLFYYGSPAIVVIPLLIRAIATYCCCSCCGSNKNNYDQHHHGQDHFNDNTKRLPSIQACMKACGISLFDIVSTSMNYAGISLAGPTLFSIIYSSVTIWCGIFSFLLLKRQMSTSQWIGISIVFVGLCITATDSLQFGSSVVLGVTLVMVGSMMHAMTYVLCEAIMTIDDEKLTVYETCGIQATTAFTIFVIWQFIYTIPNKEDVLIEPMAIAGTSWTSAIQILTLFGLANLIHSIAYYETLVKCHGGATSAAVFKGLQAVIVFVVTHYIFCGRNPIVEGGGAGNEMCFSYTKLASLITVCVGVSWYGIATSKASREPNKSKHNRHEYESIPNEADSSSMVEIEPLASSHPQQHSL